MGQQNLLLKFVIASVAVHLLIIIFLGPLNNTKQIVISIPDDYQPLEIALNTTPKQKSHKMSGKTKIENKNINVKKIIEPARRSTIEITIDNDPGKPEEQQESQQEETEQTSETIVAFEQTINHIQNTKVEVASFETRNTAIRNKLDAIIKENFSYPRFAVRRGWQGTVELGLRIEANGRLSKLRIVKTSGYRILDQAALTTLAKTSYISDIESWLAGDTFDTILPVKYQLIDG